MNILFQTYLFTGLFITSHDAKHQNVTSYKILNRIIGQISCFLFAGFSYKRLVVSHFSRHSAPTSEEDPDFNTHSQNFFIWWLKFMKNYTTILQIITMAVIYNLLKYLFNEPAVVSFWLIPAILSTLQLFYFGTYLPRRNSESNLKNLILHDHRQKTICLKSLAAIFSDITMNIMIRQKRHVGNCIKQKKINLINSN